MMYLVYAVRTDDAGEKHRHFLGTFYNLDEAKHLANCATLGNASYAYVKEIGGGTVFSISAISPAAVYEERPSPKAPRPLAR